MFSSRLSWNSRPNRLTHAIEARRASHLPLRDLTGSNPTRVGIDYPSDDIAHALRVGASAPYQPDARGLASARAVLAESLSTTEDRIDPDDLFLLASTSEAYSYLFKVLADPGDEIAIARPAYPLLEHIAALESLRIRHYSLTLMMVGAKPDRRARWAIETPDVAAILSDRTRAIVVVNPNNPTGNYASASEVAELSELCAARQIAIILDEVFLQYPLVAGDRRSLGASQTGLVFTLGGLSKLVGLPHFKLGWIRVSGTPELKAEAKAALDIVADSFLSLATPVQIALPSILASGAAVRSQISERTRRNLSALRLAFAEVEAIEVLEPEGGWSAVIRVPHVESDEDIALALLELGVLVQPGYFYDFEQDGFLVVSLLTRPDEFDDGVAQMRRYLSSRFG